MARAKSSVSSADSLALARTPPPNACPCRDEGCQSSAARTEQGDQYADMSTAGTVAPPLVFVRSAWLGSQAASMSSMGAAMKMGPPIAASRGAAGITRAAPLTW
jgi:hypothetical protein